MLNKWLSLFILFFIPALRVFAVECTAIFPTTVASSNALSTITLNNGSNISNAPGSILTTQNLVQNDPAPCDGAACTASNTLAEQIPSFNSFSGGSNISAGYKDNLNLSPGSYGSLTAGSESKVRLSPGDYYFDGNVSLGYQAEISISGAGTVRVYVNGNFDALSESEVNTQGNTNKYLFIYARGNYSMQYLADAKAVVYALGNINMNSNSSLVGAATAEGNIDVQNQASITYQSNDITNTDFGTSCTHGGAEISAFELSVGGGAASTCEAFSVAVTAKDSGGTTLTDYTGTITLSTSTGNGTWSKTANSADANGTLTPGTNDSGSATYVFDAADLGAINLNLENYHAETLTISVEDSGAGVSNTSSNLTFSNNAFVFSFNDSLDDDIVAGRSHGVQVEMVRRDVNGDCGVATNYNSGAVSFAIVRDADDPNGSAPTIPAVTFTAGVAQFQLQTSDVGKYALLAADNSLSFSDSIILGSSSVWVVRPFGFYVSVTGNPGASSAAGSPFQVAGDSFTVNVKAVQWASADDGDGDGAPDSHDDDQPGNNADLSNNNETASFGQEGNAASVALSSELFLPLNGANPGLSGSTTVSGFSNGAGSTSVSFSEVGIIELTAQTGSGSYLGISSDRNNKMQSKSSYVGRFYPDYFSLESSNIVEACTSGLNYSYMGEEFSLEFELAARNSGTTVTENYEGDFAKLNIASLSDPVLAVDSAGPTDLSSRVSALSGSFTWSEGRLSGNGSLSINRDASPDGPYSNLSLGLSVTDSDGVSLQASALNLDTNNDSTDESALLDVTTVRYGRLLLENSFGPETHSLPVNFLTQYWDGERWLQNIDDSCSRIDLNDIVYPEGSIIVGANRTVTLGSGTTTGNYSDLSATDIGFVSGSAGHFFSAPGQGNQGSFEVNVNMSNLLWLSFDWDNDGDYSELSLPSATFTFGHYRGHDRVLIWRELLSN